MFMKILDATNFLRYRAPMETSLRAEWAPLCKLSFTLLNLRISDCIVFKSFLTTIK